MLRCFVGVWVVELRGAGTVSHMGGRVDFTLAFDSSPIKGGGILSVGVVLFHPCHPAALWIDESPITLCQRVRL